MTVSANLKCEFANLRYEKLLSEKYFVETCFSKKYESYTACQKLKDLWLKIKSNCFYPFWKQTEVEEECEVPSKVDFTPIIDIDTTDFEEGQGRDFIVNITELLGANSIGQLVFKLRKMSAFDITYDSAATTASVGGTVNVDNVNWLFTEDSNYVTVKLKVGKVILAGTSRLIAFRVERHTDVPINTTQNLTVTIVTGSGGDSNSSNNQAVASFTAI